MPLNSAAVSDEMPRSDHGETTERPMPAPRVNSTTLSEAAVKPPATIAGHETAEVGASPTSATAGLTMTVSTMSSVSLLNRGFGLGGLGCERLTLRQPVALEGACRRRRHAVGFELGQQLFLARGHALARRLHVE